MRHFAVDCDFLRSPQKQTQNPEKWPWNQSRANELALAAVPEGAGYETTLNQKKGGLTGAAPLVRQWWDRAVKAAQSWEGGRFLR